jgi:mannose-6-phosphate isomerase-like protein (cupin superfamily)
MWNRRALLSGAAGLALLGLISAQAQGQTGRPPQPPPMYAWSAKPDKLTPYVAPQRPHTKLADVLARHRRQASWSEVIVDDGQMHAEWIQAAPGQKTKTQMLEDHRLGFIVWDGQLKVTIAGQEPFVAAKGFMVQVPFRTPYSLETVGDKPALRFEVKPAAAVTAYADGETPPPPVKGHTWYRARITESDTYERQKSKPYLDFFKAVEGPPRPMGAFMSDDRSFMNIVRQRGIPQQPDWVKGHFHVNYGEFWFIMEGQVGYKIEGLDYFVAEPGDIVYAAAGRFHRAQSTGTGMGTRIPLNGYPYGAHHYDPDERAPN